MQATQALYRRWRPARFSDVVAQEPIVAALRHQVATGRIAHAYLFCGSRGTGKTSMAHILARAVNCQSPEQGDACGKCEACQRLAAENNLDVVEIDAASNNGVDDIRDLREKVKYPPQHGRFRVYIIDEVHMLSAGAFNAFLKTLEEPPSHVVFILATTEPQRLPSTILSRCQRYDFHRIEASDIAGRLKKIVDSMGIDAEPEALMILARAAEGAMRDAISMLDMCLSYGEGTLTAQDARRALGATDPAFLFDLSQAFLDGDAAAALLGVDRALREGAEAQVLSRNVAGHLRALLLAKRCGDALPELLSVTENEAERYRAQAGQASDVNLLRMLDLFLASEHDMKWASQPRVALEAAAVRACLPEQALQLEALAARVEQLENALEKAMKAGVAAPQAQPARAQGQKIENASPPPAKPAARPAGPAVGSDAQAVWS
ncbi:MAG TPA: DNA polymerase III subunit gamma/tau, partial [Clostridia bacterium]|nr:DNA polymerase III subunit gamma/tau [Clostridia bacterium]